jgi:hypothetical protein
MSSLGGMVVVAFGILKPGVVIITEHRSPVAIVLGLHLQFLEDICKNGSITCH